MRLWLREPTQICRVHSELRQCDKATRWTSQTDRSNSWYVRCLRIWTIPSPNSGVIALLKDWLYSLQHIFVLYSSRDTKFIKYPTMNTCKTSCMKSILNDDANPSFSVRPVPRYSKHPPATFTQPDQSPSQPAAKHGYNSWRDIATVSLESLAHLCYNSTSADNATLARETTAAQTVPGPLTLKKNRKHKYPCPFAVSRACQSTFTTSGHAARHGKKHTGEKSVHCPTCNKAFARKDNMRQHQRTHRNFDMGELMRIQMWKEYFVMSTTLVPKATTKEGFIGPNQRIEPDQVLLIISCWNIKQFSPLAMQHPQQMTRITWCGGPVFVSWRSDKFYHYYCDWGIF